MNINFDFNEALEQLAKAFNTTVDALYPILIRQAYVDGVVAIIALLIPVIIAIIAYKMARTNQKKINDYYKKPDYWEWEDEGQGYAIAISVASFATFIALLYFFSVAPTALMNPEYHAIKQIIKVLN